MRLAAAIALFPLVAGCATTQTATRPPVPPAQLVFRESLPPETRICVALDPFRGGLTCAPLDELRAWLRSRRVVRFGGEQP